MSHLDVPKPDRIKGLPVDENGYVITYHTFIDRRTGKPDFRTIDHLRVNECIRYRKCGICGQDIQSLVCLIGGDEAVAHRLFPDPPFHEECARYALQVCPFLCNPKAKRHAEREHPGCITFKNPIAGKVRPNKIALYLTRHYEYVPIRGMPAVRPGKPVRIFWFD